MGIYTVTLTPRLRGTDWEYSAGEIHISLESVFGPVGQTHWNSWDEEELIELHNPETGIAVTYHLHVRGGTCMFFRPDVSGPVVTPLRVWKSHEILHQVDAVRHPNTKFTP
jgi:hypothetical protein